MAKHKIKLMGRKIQYLHTHFTNCPTLHTSLGKCENFKEKLSFAELTLYAHSSPMKWNIWIVVETSPVSKTRHFVEYFGRKPPPTPLSETNILKVTSIILISFQEKRVIRHDQISHEENKTKCKTERRREIFRDWEKTKLTV